MPESKAFTAGIMSLKLDYTRPGIWDTLQRLSVDDLIQRGRPEVERQERLIQELVNHHAYRVVINNIPIIAVNMDDHTIRSQLGHELAVKNKEAGIGAVVYANYTHPVWNVSFRAVNGVDTTVLSKFFGGGGHAGASGCMIPKDMWEKFKI